MKRSIPVETLLAASIWLVFGGLHLAGVRDWVSVVSGTPVEGVPLEIAAPFGALYVASWLGAVVVAPVLLLAGALRSLMDRSAPGHQVRDAVRPLSDGRTESSTPSPRSA